MHTAGILGAPSQGLPHERTQRTHLSLRWQRIWLSGTTEHRCPGTWLYNILVVFLIIAHFFIGVKVRVGKL